MMSIFLPTLRPHGQIQRHHDPLVLESINSQSVPVTLERQFEARRHTAFGEEKNS